MAQHDLTELVTQHIAAGGTKADFLALTDVQEIGGQVIAWNVRARAAAHEMIGTYQAPAATVPAATDAPLATEKQIAYAISLIARRMRSGDEGGHLSFSGGYPAADQLARMTRRQISNLIDQMRSAW